MIVPTKYARHMQRMCTCICVSHIIMIIMFSTLQSNNYITVMSLLRSGVRRNNTALHCTMLHCLPVQLTTCKYSRFKSQVVIDIVQSYVIMHLSKIAYTCHNLLFPMLHVQTHVAATCSVHIHCVLYYTIYYYGNKNSVNCT